MNYAFFSPCKLHLVIGSEPKAWPTLAPYLQTGKSVYCCDAAKYMVIWRCSESALSIEIICDASARDSSVRLSGKAKAVYTGHRQGGSMHFHDFAHVLPYVAEERAKG